MARTKTKTYEEVVIKAEWFDMLEELPSQDGQALLYALHKFLFYGIEPEFKGLMAYLWDTLKEKATKRAALSAKVKKAGQKRAANEAANKAASELAKTVAKRLAYEVAKNEITSQPIENQQVTEIENSTKIENKIENSGKGGDLFAIREKEKEEKEEQERKKEKEISPQTPYIEKEINKEKEEKGEKEKEKAPCQINLTFPKGDNQKIAEEVEVVEVEEVTDLNATTTTAKSSKKELPIEERKQQFKETCYLYCDHPNNTSNNKKYPCDMVEEFFLYWTEPNRKNTKMKFEMEKTWSIGGRLAYWERTKKTFNNKGNYGTQQPNRDYQKAIVAMCDQYIGDDDPFK